ncbi:hypothetical protein CBM2586_B30048 [Cupriavidus phytorum]|uniref:Uncharacterized protein n=1 Tax=Cupriavidus taiwanensis TaxID=164546 RepID=A0A975XJ93_9BURK|nr:hypothetical protein CBM2586_B30048 [Cupriavidus taiwanensis]
MWLPGRPESRHLEQVITSRGPSEIVSPAGERLAERRVIGIPSGPYTAYPYRDQAAPEQALGDLCPRKS